MMKLRKKPSYYQTWMTIVYDRTLKIVDIINPQHCLLLQLSEDDLIGKDVFELEKEIEGDNKYQASIISKNIRKAYNESRNVYFEYKATHKDGSTTYAVCYAEKGPDDLLYVNVIKIDEENIFEAREGFTNYVFDVGMNNISVGVVMRHIAQDGSRNYILFNDVAKEFFESEDVLKSPHWDQKGDDAADEQALQLRDSLKIEKVIRDDNGGISRWIVLTKKKISSKAGGYYIVTTMIDITKRRQNEILLEQQFTLLDSIYKNLPLGIVLYDKNGQQISFNDKNVEIFELDRSADLYKFNIYDDPNTPDWVKNKLRAGENVEYETELDFKKIRSKFICHNGRETKILTVKYIVMNNKSGEIDGFMQICEDVTEKRTTKSLIDLMYKNIPLGLIMYDREGRLLTLNEKNRQIMGITNDVDLKGLNLFEEPHMSQENCDKLRRGEDVVLDLEYRFKDIEGYFPSSHKELKYLQINISVIKSESTIIGYLLVNIDKTADKKREKLLEETSLRFESLYNSMISGMEIYDTSGVMIDCNEQDLKIFGLKCKKDLIESGLSFFNNPNLSIERTTALRQGKNVQFELWYDFEKVNKNNYYKTSRRGEICIDVKGSPMLSKEKELLGYVFVVNDITKTKRQEMRLMELYNDLEIALIAGNVFTWIYDIEGKIFTSLLGGGMSNKGIAYDDCELGVYPKDREKLRTIFDEFISGKKKKGSITLRFYNPQLNEYRYLESEMNVRKNHDGQITHITGAQKDVTDRIKHQHKLEEQNLKTDLINKACNIIQWEYDLATQTIFTHSENAVLPNVRFGEAEFLKYVHPEDHYKVKEAFRLANEHIQDKIHFEIRLKTAPSEEYIYAVSDGVAFRNEFGEIIKYSGIRRNVTPWIKLNQDLKRQGEINNLILQNTTSGIIYMDSNAKIIWSNLCYFEDSNKLSIFRKQIKGDRCIYWDRGRCKSCNDMCLVKKAVTTCSICSRTLHYSDMSFVVTAIPVLDSKQEVGGAIYKIDNTTEQERINKELMETRNEALRSNRILNEVLNKMPCAFYLKNVNDNYRYVKANKVFCQHVRKSEEEIIGKTDYDIFEEKNAKLHLKNDVLAIESGKTLIYQDNIKSFGRNGFWHVIKSAIKGPSGEQYTIGIALDMTESVKISKELKKSRDEAILANKVLNEIVDRMPGAVYMKDIDNESRFIKVNEAFRALQQRPLTDILGHTDFELLDKDEADYHNKYDLQLTQDNSIVSYDSIINRQSKLSYLHITKSLLTLPDGKRVILGIAIDDTNMHTLNRELIEAKEKAEESDKLKSAFLANMSHEIRTPLNAIVGFSDLLAETEDKSEKNEYIKIINANNELLLRLVGDVLDLSKIESGVMEIKYETFDLVSVFNDAYTSFKQKMIGSKVKFIGENPYSKCIVRLDKNKLIQVGTNFVSNAIKYTPSGFIKMGYIHERNGIKIYVEDTGIGISADKHDKVFERFEKLDTFAQGTGLGLSICKAIANISGGEIGFESEPGKGSIFWAWFPTKVESKRIEPSDIIVSE